MNQAAKGRRASFAERWRRLGGISVVVLALAGCEKPTAKQAIVPPAPIVTVAAPIVRSFTGYAEYTGRAESADSVEIRARVGGFLKEFHAQDGDIVKRGDLLFTIDPEPFEATIRARQAALEKATSALDLAKATVERSRPLAESGAVARQDFDVQEAQVVQAQANVAEAQAALETAQLDLSYTKITAPFDGRLSDAKVSVGTLVVSSSGGNGTLLASLVSVEPVYVSFDLDESTMLNYRNKNVEGPPKTIRSFNVPVSVALGTSRDFSIEGVIDYADPNVNTATGTIRVRARFENKDRQLLPGLFVRVRLALEERPNSMLIPVRAVGQDQDRHFVFVLDDKKTVQYRPVVVGTERDGLVLVQEGLTATDTVIIDGVLKVRPGIVPDTTPADLSVYAAATGGS